jgi:hypothetical protein
VPREDERLVAGAVGGSLAVEGGVPFSELDLTLGIADRVDVAGLLDDGTRTLIDELDDGHWSRMRSASDSDTPASARSVATIISVTASTSSNVGGPIS